MKSKRLFQIIVLLALLFAPLGANRSVRASTGPVDMQDRHTIDHKFPGLQDEPAVSVLVSPASVQISEITTATVRLNHVPVEGYTSAELTCTYDPNVVEASNIVIGNLFGIDPVTAVNGPHDGQFIVAIAGSDGRKATSSGVVIAFNIRGLQAGQSSVGCQARVSLGDRTLTSIASTGTKVTILENTLTPTVGPALCDKAQFVADVNVPDGTIFPPGANFTKTWRLKNVGSCTWTTSYRLVFFSGEQMGAVSSVPFTRDVAPGQTIDISVNLTAPSSPGSYRGLWMFKNSHGTLFGIGAQANKPWWLEIRVSGATATSTTTTAMRITIEPGQTTASRIGIVNPNETIRYLLNASAGQVLSITLTAPPNEVALGVDGPTGLVLKPLDASPTWSTTISTGGDHTITLMALTGSSSKSYTLVVSLTPASIVTPTATPTFGPTSCDKAEFVADISVPPGTMMAPGTQFIKTWRLKNVGTCTWTLSYRMAFLSGHQMGAPSSIQIPVNVAPGQLVDLSLPMTAPSEGGSHRGYWIFQNSTGQPFGVGSQGNEPWFVDIVVGGGTPTPTGTLPSSTLRLTKTATSQTYSSVGQTITYAFTITNMGATPLGPAQFTITDNMLGAPFNCGPANVTLAPNQNVSCSMNYQITSADMALPNITNSATAAGAGEVSAPATAVVANLVPPATPTPSITPGGPSATPGSGTVYDFAANACSATWYSGAGQLPCPGIDGDAKGFVLKLSNPVLETGTTDTRPGLLTFPQNVQNGYIQGFYPYFHVQDGDRFRATIGCEGGAINCYLAFRLDYQVGSDPIRTYWGPFLERYDGRQFSVDVSLSALAGKDVRFILTVLSAGTATGDRALWVGPIIYRADSILTPTSEVSLTPTGEASPTLTLTSTLESTPTEGTGTPMPAVGLLTGTVFAPKLVRIEAYDTNNNLVGAGWTNEDGSFKFYAASGTNSVVAMASGFLSARRSVTITDGSTTGLPPIFLIAGDIDNNNMIDHFDALTIGMSYNATTPSEADLNNDGIINVLDLELLAKNYRRVGPVDW
jgi:uncharacterized repeat protein (TIGR01451 family)